MFIAPFYILNQIKLEAKRSGLKHSIANLMNQPSCTLNATTVLKDTSFWCPNKTLSPLLSGSNTLRIIENGLKMKKLWPPKVKGVKNSKKKQLNITKVSS